VGATNWFVRMPYLLDGAIKGLLGGGLAVVLAWGTATLVSRNLMATTFFTGEQVMLGIFAGGMLGLVGSWLSVGRHLSQVWRES